jgi:hypothetical protein
MLLLHCSWKTLMPLFTVKYKNTTIFTDDEEEIIIISRSAQKI